MFGEFSASRREQSSVLACLAVRTGGIRATPDGCSCWLVVFVLTAICAQLKPALLQADDSRRDHHAASQAAEQQHDFSLLQTGNPQYRLIQTLILTTGRQAVGN